MLGVRRQLQTIRFAPDTAPRHVDAGLSVPCHDKLIHRGEDPTPPVVDLMDRIREERHIGHSELLDFIIEIHELRALSFEHGLSHALRSLKDRYFPETNNKDPEREWDDIVRWVITEAWVPVRPATRGCRLRARWMRHLRGTTSVHMPDLRESLTGSS